MGGFYTNCLAAYTLKREDQYLQWLETFCSSIFLLDLFQDFRKTNLDSHKSAFLNSLFEKLIHKMGLNDQFDLNEIEFTRENFPKVISTLHYLILSVFRKCKLQNRETELVHPKWIGPSKASTILPLPPFWLIRDFENQNTRGNVSKFSVSLACYWQIRSIYFFVNGYPRDSYVNYPRVMGSLAKFPSVFKVIKSAEVLKRHL